VRQAGSVLRLGPMLSGPAPGRCLPPSTRAATDADATAATADAADAQPRALPGQRQLQLAAVGATRLRSHLHLDQDLRRMCPAERDLQLALQRPGSG
jgi:hypothetical protein